MGLDFNLAFLISPSLSRLFVSLFLATAPRLSAKPYQSLTDHMSYHWPCERLQEELVQDSMPILVNLEFEPS